MTRARLPYSEILGSKLAWQLPEAYRSLQRPSSASSAKASTVCPLQLAETMLALAMEFSKVVIVPPCRACTVACGASVFRGAGTVWFAGGRLKVGARPQSFKAAQCARSPHAARSLPVITRGGSPRWGGGA